MAIDSINSVQKPVCTSGICAAKANNQIPSMQEKNDAVEITKKTAETPKEASTGKKWGVGIASFMVPGLGQAINGDWGKGLAFFGGALLAGMLLPALAPISAVILGTWSATHAVKTAKP